MEKLQPLCGINKPVSQSCAVAKSGKFWRATGQSNLTYKRLAATKASKVWFSYSHNCTLSNGAVLHSVCQVWLSSGPPEYSTFTYCAWLWNWLIVQDCSSQKNPRASTHALTFFSSSKTTSLSLLTATRTGRSECPKMVENTERRRSTCPRKNTLLKEKNPIYVITTAVSMSFLTVIRKFLYPETNSEMGCNAG